MEQSCGPALARLQREKTPDITNQKTYRFLTGPDDASFCQKVSDALAAGYVLHGDSVMLSHDGDVICGQAVILPGTGRDDRGRDHG